MALRLQKERMEKALLPSFGEYARVWGLSPERIALMAPHAVVLHPGPVNRGVELAHAVADGLRARILAQVASVQKLEVEGRRTFATTSGVSVGRLIGVPRDRVRVPLPTPRAPEVEPEPQRLPGGHAPPGAKRR